MIDWKNLHEQYLAYAAEGTAGLPFRVIDFALSSGGLHAYATVGAVEGPVGYDLVLVSALEFPPFGDALAALVQAGTPCPGVYAILPCAVAGTAFEALFCMPFLGGAPDDGAGESLYHVLRVVPLTGEERVLGERAVENLMPALTRAAALVVDPYRGSVVVRPHPPPGKPQVAAVRRTLRDAHRKFLIQLSETAAREVEARSGAWDSVAGARARLPPGDRPALAETFRALLAEALAPMAAALAPRTALVFAELLHVIMTTHPDAVRLLDQAFDPLGAAAAEGDASPEARMAKATDDVALAVGRFRPHEPPKDLRARARQAGNRVRASFDPSDEVPLENACWAAAFAAVYSGIREIGEPHAVMVQTIGVIERAEAMLELEPDPRPPLVRLRDVAMQTAAVLFLGYSLHATREPGSRGSKRSKGSKGSRGGVLH